MTTVESIARWATHVTFDDIPDDVRALLRAQRLSVLGGMAASNGNEVVTRVLSGLAIEGWPLGRSLESDLGAATVMSMALDFDDYVCFGHTGHSAVTVPLLLSLETGASANDQLVAQTIADEVGARLGGMCLIGPLNGQLWSFIHAAEAALSAGRIMGLDEEAMANALAISLYQPPRPATVGFIDADTKLLTATDPTLMGVRAARLAAAGVAGPLEVLDHRGGFPNAFSYAPITGMLSGLGRGWATRTLSVKPYPGCAYLDSIVDCLTEMGPPTADEVSAIRVQGGLLTCGMDALSRSSTRGESLTSVRVNFSVGATVAILLIAGELTTDQMRTSWLGEHAGQIASAMRKVDLRHDWQLTRAGSATMAHLVPPRAVLRDVGRRRLIGGVARMRKDHRSIRLSAKDTMGVIRLGREQRADGPKQFWDEDALAHFRMSLPAAVEVTTKSGRILEAETHVPKGAAGHPAHGPIRIAREKFVRHGPRLWGPERTQKILDAVEGDADDLPGLVTDQT
ncbi:MAG: MmgE/PrpD family protein [Actinomycetota bacterium]|nr:MmgE/PrpD family protein [Actinomycetota bacterium]